jgi:DNA-binding MltR family transcriptional regulator
MNGTFFVKWLKEESEKKILFDLNGVVIVSAFNAIHHLHSLRKSLKKKTKTKTFKEDKITSTKEIRSTKNARLKKKEKLKRSRNSFFSDKTLWKWNV